MIIEKLLSLQKTKAAKIVLYAYKYKGTNQVKDMKKMMVWAVGATLLLSSCSSYTGAGAYTGAQFGSIHFRHRSTAVRLNGAQIL